MPIIGISTTESKQVKGLGRDACLLMAQDGDGALPRGRQIGEPDCFVGEFDAYDAGSAGRSPARKPLPAKESDIMLLIDAVLRGASRPSPANRNRLSEYSYPAQLARSPPTDINDS